MPSATPAGVRRQIAACRPESLYLLQGDDEVEKMALAREFEALVDEDLRAFNVEVVQAGDATSGERLANAVSSIAAAARTLPMLAPWRVVVVARAEVLLSPKRDSEAAARALDLLEALLASPDPQTVLVFVAGTLDRRSRMYKLMSRLATVVDCGVLEDVSDAERWVRNRVTAAGTQIEPGAARLLAERAGTDVVRLRNDVDRVLLYALGQPTVHVGDVREIAGPAALQDDWAMPTAVEAGDTATALRQLGLMVEAGAPPEKVLGQLGWLVRTKFPAAALPAAVDALFRTDVDLKRSAGSPRILLERLVVELCAGRRGRSATGSQR
jgi:DNA polymerase-3 subunit delta